MRIIEGNYAENIVGVCISPAPLCKLFQIHGSNFKLNPVCNLSQACVSGVTHSVQLLGIRKDTLYRFFSGFVHPLVDWCVPGIVSHFLVFLPDVRGNSLDAILVFGTEMSCRTVTADMWITFIFPITIPVCCTVVSDLVFRAYDAVEMLVIYILPPFMSALHCLWTLVCCG